MWIPIPGKDCLYFETGSWSLPAGSTLEFIQAKYKQDDHDEYGGDQVVHYMPRIQWEPVSAGLHPGYELYVFGFGEIFSHDENHERRYLKKQVYYGLLISNFFHNVGANELTHCLLEDVPVISNE